MTSDDRRYFGDITMVIWRPSMRGICSTLAILSRSSLHPHQHVHAELLVRQLAAAEAHGHLDLVAFLDEFEHAAHLDVVIVVVDAGAQLDLLDLDDLLLLARLVLVLLLFVFELAEIEDLADRRIGVGRRPRRGRGRPRSAMASASLRVTTPTISPRSSTRRTLRDGDLVVDARPVAGRRRG